MRCYANQLPANLARSLAPFYMVFGDEPYQAEQAVQQIKQQAKQHGFDEVIKLAYHSGFNWQKLDSHYASMSLFSSRILIELDLNQQKPAKTGADHLKRYCENPNPDCIIILKGQKAGQDIQRSAWFKALDKQGVFVPCYPLEGAHFSRWLDTQLKRLNLRLAPDAKRALLDATQGNLLACAQELEKLALLHGEQPISEQQVLAGLLNQSQFDIFDLSASVLAGNAEQALTILSRLQAKNVEPTTIAWALNKELNTLTQLQQLQQQNAPLNSAFKQLGIWQKQQGQYQHALARLPLSQTAHLSTLLAQFDSHVKRGELSHIYAALGHICTAFCQPVPFALPILASD